MSESGAERGRAREIAERRTDALAREIAERRTGMPSYLVGDEAWVAAVAEAEDELSRRPPVVPLAGLRLTVRKAFGGPLLGDSRTDREAYYAAIEQQAAPDV